MCRKVGAVPATIEPSKFKRRQLEFWLATRHVYRETKPRGRCSHIIASTSRCGYSFKLASDDQPIQILVKPSSSSSAAAATAAAATHCSAAASCSGFVFQILVRDPQRYTVVRICSASQDTSS